MISDCAYINPEAKIDGNVTMEPFAVSEADIESGEGADS